MVELTDNTIQLVNRLFSENDRNEALELLRAECGDTLHLVLDILQSGNERIRFAAIKISEGLLDKLYYAIDLAQKDWRDLLVFAGFGNDVKAHKTWEVEILSKRSIFEEGE